MLGCVSFNNNSRLHPVTIALVCVLVRVRVCVIRTQVNIANGYLSFEDLKELATTSTFCIVNASVTPAPANLFVQRRDMKRKTAPSNSKEGHAEPSPAMLFERLLERHPEKIRPWLLSLYDTELVPSSREEGVSVSSTSFKQLNSSGGGSGTGDNGAESRSEAARLAKHCPSAIKGTISSIIALSMEIETNQELPPQNDFYQLDMNGRKNNSQ